MTLAKLAETYNVRLHLRRMLAGFAFCTLLLLIVLHPLLIVAPVAFYCIGMVLLDPLLYFGGEK